MKTDIFINSKIWKSRLNDVHVDWLYSYDVDFALKIEKKTLWITKIFKSIVTVQWNFFKIWIAFVETFDWHRIHYSLDTLFIFKINKVALVYFQYPLPIKIATLLQLISKIFLFYVDLEVQHRHRIQAPHHSHYIPVISLRIHKIPRVQLKRIFNQETIQILYEV